MSTEKTLKEREEIEQEYLKFMQEFRRKNPSKFAPSGYAEVKPHDHPTLSDFDRIRLETALVISQTDQRGSEFADALAAADRIINRVLNTPFERVTESTKPASSSPSPG